MRRIKAIMPHRRELKNEHFMMCGAYGVGSYFTHSIFGMVIISVAYFVVFTWDVHEMRQS